MATLREWLEEEDFDWTTGVIIAHTLKEGSYSPGWGTADKAFKFDFRDNTLPDNQVNALLDHEFDDGYDLPEAPMFIAKDKNKMYFPWQYDGATGITVVYNDIDKYMDTDNEIPYPGG